MTHELTEPVPPDLTDPLPLGSLHGDPTDDDGTVIDEAYAAGPDRASGVVRDTGPYPTESLPPVQRIISRSVQIGSSDGGATFYAPVQLFAPDPRRKRLVIQSVGAASIVVQSERSDCFAAVEINLSSNNLVGWEGYTGAVWVWFNRGTALVTALGWSFTE